VRRWTLLIAGAALWLFLAAVPALADGGPHVSADNSGVNTLTTDNCAGCHRAHTAQGAYLLKSNEEDLCLTCHGTNGAGATVNVEDGVQYNVANNGTYGGDSGPIVGALRGGGFVYARISSTANITRVPYPRDSDSVAAGVQLAVSFSSQVKVLGTGSGTTSAHLDVGGAPGVNPTGVAWGNGAANSGVGPVVTLHCASCHNPHGNGAYRILNPIPSPDASTGSSFTPAAQAIYVNEVRVDPTTGTSAAENTRNYTVQWGATLDDVIGAKAYPSGTAASPTLGDYWRLYQPYNVVPQGTGGDPPTAIANPATLYSGDMPEFIPPAGGGTTTNPASPASSTRWRQQITAWCSTCHSRYNTQQAGASSTSPVTTTNPADNSSLPIPGGFGNGRPYASGTGSYNTDSGDAIYKYRHGTQNRQCTMCHVAHGSNAVMDTEPTTAGAQGYSGNYPYPNGTTSASSRLLKVDNRGTCQQCHDPTGTIKWNSAPITH
jgi:predicted CXXCH cytochrome family protein